MRRQNPPQAYIDKARNIEKYLRPLTLASVYALCGIVYFALVSLIFASLVYESVLRPTPVIITIFAVVGFVPTIFIFLASFLRPNDPLSSCITSMASVWRNPLRLPPESCTFKAWLRNGEAFSIDLAFFYPTNHHTHPVKERMYTCVHAALAKDFSTRLVIPTSQEIEGALDAPLEMVAAEWGISVLYLEVHDILGCQEENPLALEYLSTGTYN